MLQRYLVITEKTVTTYTTVQAETETEALAAMERGAGTEQFSHSVTTPVPNIRAIDVICDP